MSDLKTKDTHIISMLVANKPGVLVRVALVFARRAFNIDSLVVSPSINPKYSRMTITAKGAQDTLEQIIKNCNKLVDVIHASEHDPSHSLDRELALIKVKATSAAKQAVAKYSKKYHVKIIDSAEGVHIIAQTGTTDELDAFEQIMKKYSIVEMVRSGKLLMALGKEAT